MRDRLILDSSAIAEVIYVDDRETLEVQYREGERYRYFRVPFGIYEALLAAESAGAFWNSVKDRYDFERLS